MAKRFIFSTPEQLKEIVGLCRDGASSSIVNAAKVWSVTKRQKGETPWDGRIGVSFHTKGRERRACVFRIDMKDDLHVLGWLKYNAALQWCSEHLERTD